MEIWVVVCCYDITGYGPEGIMLWAGRHYVMGRKACNVDRKVGVGRTGRFTQQGRKSPETHGSEGPTELWPGKAYVW